ncbi:MAG TPA: prepilin-type N-terminal cleavage/methylation domain-containing protein [Candidatus Xenobia bacterium]|jgi:prepilin-type N-terminal cleavage/methylation domain-containing protein
MRGRRPAFTLIEVMICIAILAILYAVPFGTRNSYHAVVREADYRYALHNAQAQLDVVRKQPFDRLPPELIAVPTGGVLHLGHRYIEPGTLRAWTAGHRPVRFNHVDTKAGQLAVSPSLAGQTLVIDYQYRLPDLAETHTVAADGTVTLWNAPVLAVDTVRAAQGDALVPLSIGPFDHVSGVLHVGGPAQVVEVDYLGERIHNVVAGTFMDEALHPTTRPGPIKLLTVEEAYAERVNRMAVSVLRMKDKP